MGSDGTVPSAALLRECHAAFDWWERVASSRRGTGLMFAWALAEATVWPIIPDFLLVPMAVGNRRRFYVPLAAAVAGMALGGIAIFLFAFWAPHQALDFLRQLPLVNNHQIDGAREHLGKNGVAAFLFQPWSGISFKVWGVTGGVQGLNPLLVIPTFILARSVRMAIFATAAALLSRRFAGFVRDFFIFLLVIYGALFFYGLWQVTSLS